MKLLGPSELARLSGVSADTLRHYERKGLLKSRRTESGYRRYTENAVERVRLIQRALSVGFSLQELAKTLAKRDAGGAPCSAVRASVAAHLAELDTRIAELLTFKETLQNLLRAWDTRIDTTPPNKQARLLDELAQRDCFIAPARRPLRQH